MSEKKRIFKRYFAQNSIKFFINSEYFSQFPHFLLIIYKD